MEERRRRRRKKPQDENIMSASATQSGHKNEMLRRNGPEIEAATTLRHSYTASVCYNSSAVSYLENRRPCLICVHNVAPACLLDLCVPAECVRGCPRLRSLPGCIQLPGVNRTAEFCVLYVTVCHQPRATVICHFQTETE